MSQLYPFLVIPIFDERPWGVRDLRPVYTKVVNEPIGESWLTWEDNRVANGPLAGQSIGDLAKRYRRELVGSLAYYEDRFPLLIKFLFPGDKLSVQVHPDDAGAQKYGQPCGKTECWYVLRAEPGAQVALGLKAGVTLEEFRKSIEETRAEELLNWVDVFAGDMLYVAAGTVHTIGGGMILVETQQTSDITYRLYDYGRPRELHLDQGVAVADGRPYQPSLHRRLPPGGSAQLVDGEHFRLDRIAGHPDAVQVERYRGQPVLVIPLSGAVGTPLGAVHPGECGCVASIDDLAFDSRALALLAQPIGAR